MRDLLSAVCSAGQRRAVMNMNMNRKREREFFGIASLSLRNSLSYIIV
jgi:hypothetical protein